MAATEIEIFKPLLKNISDVIPKQDSQDTVKLIKATLGGAYAKQNDLMSLFEELVSSKWITYDNTELLRECLSSNKEVQQKIINIVENFIVTHKADIQKTSQTLQFIGRETEISELHEVLITNKQYFGTVIWGAAGVGKTTFIKEFCNRLERSWRIDQDLTKQIKNVDLRGVTQVPHVYVEFLRSFGYARSVKDVSLDMVLHLLENIEKQNYIIFDNADNFIGEDCIESNNQAQFLEMVEKVVIQSNLKLMPLITARTRCSHPGAERYLYQKELGRLSKSASSKFVLPSVSERGLSQGDADLAARLCGHIPLALNILRAQLKERSITFDEIIGGLKQALERKQQTEKDQREILEGESSSDSYTDAVIAINFNRLTHTLQSAAVSISLFARSFSFGAIREIFSESSDQQNHLILTALEHVNFVTRQVIRDSNGDSVFDLHPKIKSFLHAQSSNEEFLESYQKRRLKFLNYFQNYLVKIGNMFDSSYSNAYNLFEDNRLNFETLLTSSYGTKAFLILDNFTDLQTVACLFEALVDNSWRANMFSSWGKDAESRGDLLRAAHCYCLAGIQKAHQSPGNVLRGSLLKAEDLLKLFQKTKLESLTTYIRREKYMQLRQVACQVKALRGRCLYLLARQSLEVDKLRESLKCYEEALSEAEEVLKDNRTEICRFHNAIGNIYNLLKDFSTGEERLRLTEQARLSYEKSLDLRRQFSGTVKHLDTPIVLQSLATIYEEEGKFEKAMDTYNKALDMERELNVDGFLPTALILRNLADLYLEMRKFDVALPIAERALSIRERILGSHPDTVRCLYQIAVIKYSAAYKDKGVAMYKDALDAYIHAFELEEDLREDNHSALRFRIREDMIDLFETAIEDGYPDFEEEFDKWRKIFKELEEGVNPVDSIGSNTDSEHFELGAVSQTISSAGGVLEFRLLGVGVSFPAGAVVSDTDYYLSSAETLPFMIQSDYEAKITDTVSFYTLNDQHPFKKKLSVWMRYNCFDYNPGSQQLVFRHIQMNFGKPTITDHEITTTETLEDGFSKITMEIDKCGFFAIVQKLKRFSFMVTNDSALEKVYPFPQRSISLNFVSPPSIEEPASFEAMIYEFSQKELRKIHAEGYKCSPVLIIHQQSGEKIPTISCPLSVELPLSGIPEGDYRVFVIRRSDKEPWQDITVESQTYVNKELSQAKLRVTNFSDIMMILSPVTGTVTGAIGWFTSFFNVLNTKTQAQALLFGKCVSQVQTRGMACIAVLPNLESVIEASKIELEDKRHYTLMDRRDLDVLYYDEVIKTNVFGRLKPDRTPQRIRFRKDGVNRVDFNLIENKDCTEQGDYIDLNVSPRLSPVAQFACADWYQEILNPTPDELGDKLDQEEYLLCGVPLDSRVLRDVHLSDAEFWEELRYIGVSEEDVVLLRSKRREFADSSVFKYLLKLLTEKYFTEGRLKENWCLNLSAALNPHVRTELEKAHRLLSMRILDSSQMLQDVFHHCNVSKSWKNIARVFNLSPGLIETMASHMTWPITLQNVILKSREIDYERYGNQNWYSLLQLLLSKSLKGTKEISDCLELICSEIGCYLTNNSD